MSDGDFPGLNKGHGFYKVIEKNQSERDSYHWEQKELKEKKREEIEAHYIQAKQERRKQRRERQRPDRQVYVPPKTRLGRIQSNILYHIDIEVEPDVYWQQSVTVLGKEEELVQSAADKYKLSEKIKNALIDVISEFEMNLK